MHASRPTTWCVLTTAIGGGPLTSRTSSTDSPVVPVGEPVVEQLRDVAILATIALLFVLTLQILWLTKPKRHQTRDRR